MTLALSGVYGIMPIALIWIPIIVLIVIAAIRADNRRREAE